MQRPSSNWSNSKERGGLGLLTLVLYFYRLGGRWLCRIVLYFVILWYWLFAVSARQASLNYMRQLHLFAGVNSPFPNGPSLANSYQHFIQFGTSILDKMEGWLGHIPEQELQLFGHQHFQQTYQKGALLVVSHFGNIELLRAVKSQHSQKINVLVYQKHATQFNTFLKKLNDQADINLISVDELGLETAILLEEKMQHGEWVIVAADRAPVHSNRVQHIDFLGQEAVWPQGAWILASLLKVPVLAVFCYRQHQHFEVHIHKITDIIDLPRKNRIHAMQTVTRKYVTLLEQHCLRAPYQWFNFYHFWTK
ncbi:acyltransferase [Acinetobacter sp. S40]|uniref:LpxL/LpxP family acyltransferase n=1 Tax=unclassified Acinetobacter TaxID=196816 RepID=UPI00190B744C|nr:MULTISPECIES: acyltransferase [unclassified Acinetobacter]MBJ9985574.1 acyltransferase [Acinetobacter sp. S40]MBK0064612.1 acyltransferase [Acinetobacter sp. S55]MBK0067999.1 acyltransferase [Acinetobacter sp. S54]